MEISVRMFRERDTKNTVRYAEVPADARKPDELRIGTLYIPKVTLRRNGGEDYPAEIMVTVQA